MGDRSRTTKNKRVKSATTRAAAVRARIVKLRKDRGLSAAAVATELGLSRPFYTQLEGGTRRMDLVYFLMICGVLKADPRELLE